jgi:hypothetical protein
MVREKEGKNCIDIEFIDASGTSSVAEAHKMVQVLTEIS